MPHVPEPFSPGKVARLSKTIDSLERLAGQLRDSVERAQQLVAEISGGRTRGGRKTRRRTRKAR